MALFNEYEALIGAFCKKASLREIDQNDVLFLELSKNGFDYNLAFVSEGDCCSYTWIESVEDIDLFNGHKILDFEVVEGGDEWNGDDDLIRWTFYKFKTTGGYITVEMRNSSNGYYSGRLNLEFYGLDFKQFYSQELLDKVKSQLQYNECMAYLNDENVVQIITSPNTIMENHREISDGIAFRSTSIAIYGAEDKRSNSYGSCYFVFRKEPRASYNKCLLIAPDLHLPYKDIK